MRLNAEGEGVKIGLYCFLTGHACVGDFIYTIRCW